MAFPTIGAPTTQSFTAYTTSHVVTLPPTTAGRLLLIVWANEEEQTPITPAGWTRLFRNQDDMTLCVYAKIADGSEGGTTIDFVTRSRGIDATVHIYYASDADYELGGVCVVVSSRASGSSTTPNPPSLTTGWGAVDVTWIAVALAEISTFSAAPASYTDFTTSGSSKARLASAQRDLNAASQDPGTFTASGSNRWYTITIGVRRQPNPKPTLTNVSPSTFRDAQTGVVLTGTNFQASQGTGRVIMTDGVGDLDQVTVIEQVVTAWADTSITITIEGTNFGAGDLYLWVENSFDNYSTPFAVTLEETPVTINPAPVGTAVGNAGLKLGVEIYASRRTNVGKTTAGSGPWFPGETMLGKQIIVPAAMTVYSAKMLMQRLFFEGECMALIYADSGGGPGALVGQSDIRTMGVTEKWWEFKFSTPVALAAGTYWLAVWGQTSGFALSHVSTGGNISFRVTTGTWPTAPTPLTTETMDNPELSFYVLGTLDSYPALGFVPDVIDAETDEAISEIGRFQFRTYAMAPGVEHLAIGREVKIEREEEGTVFHGKIEHIDKVIANDERLIVVSGSSLATELASLNSMRGIVLDDALAPAAFDQILANTYGWDGQVIGNAFTRTTRRIDNQSIYSAARDFADAQHGYLRETPTPRVLELRKDARPTEIRLTNLEYVDPATQTNPRIGFLSSINVTQEAEDLWNRVVPEIKNDGDRLYTLRQSTRTTPYEIQSTLINRPSVAFAVSWFSPDVPIVVKGENRLLVAFLEIAGHTAGTIPNVEFAGRPCTLITDLVNWAPEAFDYGVWILIAPPIGDGTFRLRDISDRDITPYCGGSVFVIQDADQVEPMRSYRRANGSSTTPSNGAMNSNNDDLVIDSLVMDVELNTVSPNAPQTEWLDAPIPSGITRRRAGSSRPGATTVTVGWTLTTSSAWVDLALSIRPAFTYYLEDAASVEGYDLRIKPLPLGEYRPPDHFSEVAAVNSMYDEAAQFLLTHKDPATFYKAAAVVINQGARDWNVGDALYVEYNDADAGLAIADYAAVVRRRARYDQDGRREWDLTLSDTLRLPTEENTSFRRMAERLTVVQAAQV